MIHYAKDRKWEEGMYENTEMSYLWEDKETGQLCFLVKLHPGSWIPLHDHPRREIAYLVEGEVRLNDDIMVAGDFLTAGVGESHDVYTETGCTFFIFIDYDAVKTEVKPKEDLERK